MERPHAKRRGPPLDLRPPPNPASHVRRPVAAALAAAFVLSACQDPAGVGLGLIDEDQSDPSVRIVPLAEIDTLAISGSAIGIADPNNALGQSRVLVGQVLDPVYGDARAIGYVDAIQPAAARELEAGEVRQVWLEMPRSYAYGDTTTTLPVELHAIQGSWEARPSYPADTVFAVGPTLATADLAPGDTLARFDLPASWVSANAATLVGDDFGDAFEGFGLQTAAGFAAMPGAVYGLGTFAADGAGLRVATDEDTLRFGLSEVFTSISTTVPTAPPPGVLPLRYGSGAAVQFQADLAAVGSTPLARALLRFSVDESLTEQGSFVRPLPRVAFLFGVGPAVDADPTCRVLGLVTFADGVASLSDSRILTRCLQTALVNPAAGFDRFEIRQDNRADNTPASLDVLPIVLPTPGMDRPPRFTLTLVGPSV